MEDKKTLSELTVKLSVDADEALETIAKVKEGLEQIVALHEKIAELKVQVPVRQEDVVIKVDGNQIAKMIIPSIHLELQRQGILKLNTSEERDEYNCPISRTE